MKKYGLIGYPLGHSFSPQIHALLGDYEYRLYPLQKEDVGAFLLSGSLDAMNVTIPYKETVIPYLSRLSDEARRIGSVNTVIREADGTLTGYNTDYFGFTAMLGYYGIEPRGKKVLVLGSGGAGKTARTALSDMGAREVVTISRSGENNYGNLYLHRDAELVVNTTPLGMYPKNGEAAVDLREFPNCSGVVDMVYNPGRTALLLQAEALGIDRAYGLSMLVAQAIRAAEYFFDKRYSEDTLPRVLSAVASQMRNIVLVGMPGCGKSTVGRLISEMTGKKLVDCDTEVQVRSGMTPAQWITERGEAEFRAVESEVLRELGAQSGLVIATGGGAVTVADNKSLLRQNGSVFFIDRAPELLACEGRPLSGDLAKRCALYEKRLPMYRDFCDAVISSDERSTPVEVAAAVVTEFSALQKRG